MRISPFFLSLFVGVFFCGCAALQDSKEALKNELLQYSSKASLKKGDETYLFYASYLSPLFFKDNKKEDIFGLAVLPEDLKILNVLVQGSSKNVRLQSTSTQEAKRMGFYVPWAKHYLIYSPAHNTNSLEISIALDDANVSLSFVKVLRSLLKSL